METINLPSTIYDIGAKEILTPYEWLTLNLTEMGTLAKYGRSLHTNLKKVVATTNQEKKELAEYKELFTFVEKIAREASEQEYRGRAHIAEIINGLFYLNEAKGQKQLSLFDEPTKHTYPISLGNMPAKIQTKLKKLDEIIGFLNRFNKLVDIIAEKYNIEGYKWGKINFTQTKARIAIMNERLEQNGYTPFTPTTRIRKQSIEQTKKFLSETETPFLDGWGESAIEYLLRGKVPNKITKTTAKLFENIIVSSIGSAGI